MITFINISGLLLIGLIIWWFWIAKPKSRTAKQGSIEIIVENGVYTPSRIETSVGQTIRLEFLRKDPSPCAEQVVFSDFDINKSLPLGQTVELELTPTRSGEFDFTCQMQMYRGTLVVNER